MRKPRNDRWHYDFHIVKKNKCMERRNWYSVICTLGRNPIVADCHGQHTFFFSLLSFWSARQSSGKVNRHQCKRGLRRIGYSMRECAYFFFLLLPARVQPPVSYRNLVPCPSFSFFFFFCSRALTSLTLFTSSQESIEPKGLRARTFSSVSSTKRLSASPSFLSTRRSYRSITTGSTRNGQELWFQTLSLCYFPCCCCCSCCKDV